MDQTDFSPTKDGGAAISAEQLRNLVDRIERLEQEKAGIADDIKDCYGEAKSLGYDVKILRKVISLRKRKPNERREEEELPRDLPPGAGRSRLSRQAQCLSSATIEPSQSGGGGSVMNRPIRRP